MRRYFNQKGIDYLSNIKQSSIGNIARELGIRHVLAFDRPGQLAFLEEIDVIAVDGLTTNFEFQKKLEENGLQWLNKQYKIDAFIGPLESKPWLPGICNGTKYLGAMCFVCDDNQKTLKEVKIFSRLSGKEVGIIKLNSLLRKSSPFNNELAIYYFIK